MTTDKWYQPDPVIRWVNVYEDGKFSGWYDNKKQAIHYRANRHRNVMSVPVKITFLPPQGEDDDTVHT